MERSEIFQSMARTLFVLSIADHHDEEETNWTYPYAPGGGVDWFDCVTVDTPEVCEIKANSLIERFEADNERRVTVAAAEWAMLEGHSRDIDNANGFGHYLVMMFLGHGVGLWDDVSEPADGGFEVGNTDDVNFWEWYEEGMFD